MKCPKCHTDNPETVKFCGEYGAHIRHLSPLGGLPAKRGEDRFEEGLRS
jgi:hypothetical protein